MNYKNGRQNHDFQIAHFLVGACHTADAAYALLQDQFEDRDNAIKLFEGTKMREEAKRLKAQSRLDSYEEHCKLDPEYVLSSLDKIDILEAKADLSDIDAMKETTERNLAAAVAERTFIKLCMDKLEPLRKYGHLSLAEAAQAAQRDEWRLELMTRAENFLLTQGSIPHDHFNTMRMHPDFKRIIFPHANNLQTLLHHGQREEAMKYALENKPEVIDVVQVLGLAYEEREAVPALEHPSKLGNATAPALAFPDFRRRS